MVFCYCRDLKMSCLEHFSRLNPNLYGLFRGSFSFSCLKLVEIILETSNLARKYTPICSFRKYTFYCLGPLNFADVSIFPPKLAFFLQKSTFTQSNSVRTVLEFFSSALCKIKGYYYWKHNFCRPCVRNLASGQLQIG